MTLKQTKISAVIPTFMEEEYIATLLSKLARKKPQLEVIVVAKIRLLKLQSVSQKKFTK